ncbi:response regulator transcription factor [Sphingomonas citri]|uniref:Response regulator n=1 Tax=Sphingomonas citri TaxID=2862499 RepID=A0ABS7BPH6_9SPHN|nr:response regulator [Sphingomonas citri]MBW6531508.1 response regulator [Sphingomonas citri]
MAHIIVADDDDIWGELVCDALRAAGHTAGALTDSRDALRAIKARRPDLVVLDCSMPELSGVLLLQELRKSPQLFDLPVLMLTGRRNDQDVQLAYFAGCNDYLKKPCDPEEVVYRVQRLLEKFPPAVAPLRRVAPGSFGRRAPGR